MADFKLAEKRGSNVKRFAPSRGSAPVVFGTQRAVCGFEVQANSLGSTPKFGGRAFLWSFRSVVDFWFSSALSDDAKAVVLEIPEAIRATLDQLHLAGKVGVDSVLSIRTNAMDPIGVEIHQ
jgi:hypothetical protein